MILPMVFWISQICKMPFTPNLRAPVFREKSVLMGTATVGWIILIPIMP